MSRFGDQRMPDTDWAPTVSLLPAQCYKLKHRHRACLADVSLVPDDELWTSEWNGASRGRGWLDLWLPSELRR
jgi:hypothetical protein